MKKIWIPVLLAAEEVVGGAVERREPDIIVFMHNCSQPQVIIAVAKGQAQRMLETVGISVAWGLGKSNYHGPAEVIEAVLTEWRPDGFRPGALAFAMLGQESGTRIEIFYNRVRASPRDSSAVPLVLAHVLVHEITHILEGVQRHSESGMMKAHWDISDYARMGHGHLPFAAEDIRLIHEWRARHNQPLVAGLR